jgi:cellulose synthase (UDP-forming)
MLLVRSWGGRRLVRGRTGRRDVTVGNVQRIPVGLSCAWWLLTRRTRDFRWVLPTLLAGTTAALAYAALGLAGLVPWHATAAATVASGAWPLVAASALAVGLRRSRVPATSRDTRVPALAALRA